MPKVLNINHDVIPKGAIFIGRPSAYGNPFHIGRDGTRSRVIRLFENYLNSNPKLVAKIRADLAGHDLVCYCSPKKCHGDVLLRIANAQP